MEVTKSLSKEDEVFMPSFLHSHRNHRNSLTVTDDVFHAKISKKKKPLVNRPLQPGQNFSCGTQLVILNRQDSSILPTRVANHST